jgi:hypothetical protein
VGATGILVMRGDSAFYNAAVLGTCRRHDVRFSITAEMDPKIKAAIAATAGDVPAGQGLRAMPAQ